MNAPLNFGVIGAGAIAQTHLQAFADVPAARLAGVADANRAAAEKAVATFGGQAFGSAEALLDADLGLDAVIICTPPNTHEDLAVACAGRGLHVLCEKPFTLTSPMARRMVAAAERGGAMLTMASKFRYTPDVGEAKRIVASGLLGETILFENVFASRVDMTGRWNAQPGISGGGVLVDNGAHSVDLVRYFLGPLSEVHAVEGKRVQTPTVEDTVRVFVRSKSGVMGSIDLSWTLNKETDSYISVYGSLGTLHVGWKSSRYRLHGDAEWTVFGGGYKKVEAFARQLANFCGAVRGAETLVIGPDDAVASVAAIEAAYRSLNHCAWTDVRTASRESAELVEAAR